MRPNTSPGRIQLTRIRFCTFRCHWASPTMSRFPGPVSLAELTGFKARMTWRIGLALRRGSLAQGRQCRLTNLRATPASTGCQWTFSRITAPDVLLNEACFQSLAAVFNSGAAFSRRFGQGNRLGSLEPNLSPTHQAGLEGRDLRRHELGRRGN